MLKIKLLKKTGRKSCLVLFPPALRLGCALLPANGFSGWLWGFYFLLNLDVLDFHLN